VLPPAAAARRGSLPPPRSRRHRVFELLARGRDGWKAPAARARVRKGGARCRRARCPLPQLPPRTAPRRAPRPAGPRRPPRMASGCRSRQRRAAVGGTQRAARTLAW